MKNLTWQNPEQLFVAQELINKVKSKCCGIKVVTKGKTAKGKVEEVNEYNRCSHLYDDDDYSCDDDDRCEHYEEFAGTYAQDVAGYSDEDIYDAFDGDPEAYWNID